MRADDDRTLGSDVQYLVTSQKDNHTQGIAYMLYPFILPAVPLLEGNWIMSLISGRVQQQLPNTWPWQVDREGYGPKIKDADGMVVVVCPCQEK